MSDPLLPGPLNSDDGPLRRRTTLSVDDVGTEHQRRRAVDDVIDLADLIVLGDRVRRRLVQLAAIHHADADVGLADFDVSHLLIDQLFGDRLLACRPRARTAGMYVPGHMLQVGCGSVGLIFPCATTTAATSAARPSADSIFRMSAPTRNSVVFAFCILHLALRSLLLPGVPRAQDLPGDPCLIRTRYRLELLHAAREAVGEIEIAELIGGHAVRAAEPSSLRRRARPSYTGSCPSDRT